MRQERISVTKMYDAVELLKQPTERDMILIDYFKCILAEERSDSSEEIDDLKNELLSQDDSIDNMMTELSELRKECYDLTEKLREAKQANYKEKVELRELKIKLNRLQPKLVQSGAVSRILNLGVQNEIETRIIATP